MADEKARFTLRIPQDLYEALKISAEKNKRSVVKEIEFALEEFMKNHQQNSKE